jgi:hypothetical protein
MFADDYFTFEDFREQQLAASLKLVEDRHVVGSALYFREQQLAASLKRRRRTHGRAVYVHFREQQLAASLKRGFVPARPE